MRRLGAVEGEPPENRLGFTKSKLGMPFENRPLSVNAAFAGLFLAFSTSA